MDMKISEIMMDKMLLRRFDALTTNHILMIWKRTTDGFDSFLLSSGNQVFWECTEVQIPFQRIEDATLMMLMSEGDHPTDGHDYLFLVINDLVQRYNSLTRRLSVCSVMEHSDSETNQDLHPNFLLHGSSGAVSVSTIASNYVSDLSSFAESFWCAAQNKYDKKKMASAVLGNIKISMNMPSILSPTTFLREKNYFKDDNSPHTNESDGAQAAVKSSEDDYFVHLQDLQLFEDVKQGLHKLNIDTGDANIRRAICVNFHYSEYNHLRSILDGIRAAVGLLTLDVIQNNESFGDALSAILQLSNADKAHRFLEKLGFPVLQNGQAEFIKALRYDQLYEMVLFLGHQLASEAYLFANLPPRLTDPLSKENKEEIHFCFGQYCSQKGVQRAVSYLDEFVKDILSFYENQICDASMSNQTLKLFLRDSNFCDNECFPFFDLIPHSVTTCNYVSLRQCLHQLKLATLSNHGDNQFGDKSRDRSENHGFCSSFTNPKRGKCWLWNYEECTQSLVTDDVEMEDAENATGSYEYDGLWFESAPNKSSLEDDISLMSTDMLDNFNLNTSKTENPHRKRKAVEIMDKGAAAIVLQSWWREQIKEIERIKCNVVMKGNVSSMQADPLTKYGEPRGVLLMREWLNDNKLPGSLCDKLVSIGARCIDDVSMVMESCPEELGDIAPLDKVKLEKAVSNITY